MSANPESETRAAPESTETSRRGKNPESLKNLRRGDQPPERHVEAMAQALDPSAVAEEVSLYEDMKHVRRFPKVADRTEGQRDARKWKERDLKGFMGRFADLEKAALAAKAPPAEPAPSVAPESESWSGNPVLDELLAPEIAWIERVGRHRAAVEGFLDREGMT